MRTYLGALSVGIVTLLASVASANLFIDFEAPTYTGSSYPGTLLPGQDGWNGLITNADAYVATSGSGILTAPLSGAQSVITGTSAPYSFPFRKAVGAGFQDGSIFSGLVIPNAVNTEFDLTATINNDTYAGAIFDTGGVVKASSGTNVSVGTYVPGNRHKVEITLNYTNQNYVLKVDDLTAATSFTSEPIPFRIVTQFNPDGIVDTADAEAGDILIGTIGAGGAVFDDISVVSPAPPGIVGDYNSNGAVDAADYLIWRKNNGTSNTLPNDAIGGTIGSAQFNQWRSNFGKPPGSGSSLGLSAVPEPGTLMLVGPLLLVALASRRWSSIIAA